MTESQVEKKLRIAVEQLGGLCIKHHSPYHRGMPDRLVMLPGGLTYWVELKTATGELSKLQKVARKKLIGLGQKYILLEGEQGLKDCITHFKLVVNAYREDEI